LLGRCVVTRLRRNVTSRSWILVSSKRLVWRLLWISPHVRSILLWARSRRWS
jgi:hypothetical protein